MSLREFWLNLRQAVPLAPVPSIVDAPPADAAAIDAALEQSPGWLALKTVAGFDAGDFAPPVLSDEQCQSLSALVQQFRELARAIPPWSKASEVQAEAAQPILRDILLLLEFDRYGDGDAFAVGKRIEQRIEPYWPDFLLDLRFETGYDAFGDPAIWIWAVMQDDVEDKELIRRGRLLNTMLFPTAREVEPRFWPFIRCRGESEQQELLELEAR